MKKFYYAFLLAGALASAPSAFAADTFADPSIEGTWKITLNGHYLGSYSIGEFTEDFEATLEGDVVTFASSGSQYNIKAVFTAENTLTFEKMLVGSSTAKYGLWQYPFYNSGNVQDLESLKEDPFRATYNPAEGTIVFPGDCGLKYGYFDNETGELSYWDDAFDFVSAFKSEVVIPDYGDSSIEGDWEFVLDGHYLGTSSIGVFSETFSATLDGNVVTFESSQSPCNIVADFVGVNTLEFKLCPVGPDATFTLYQSPYVNTLGATDLDELVQQSFQATYNPTEGTIVFPSNSGLKYGYFDENGVPTSWIDAYDFVSAGRPQDAELVGQYTWLIQPTDISGDKTGETTAITVAVKVVEGEYRIYESDNTGWFGTPYIPFEYNDASKLATFTPVYVGEADGKMLWCAACVLYETPYNSMLEPQPSYGITFDSETGFEFKEDGGIAWYVSSSASVFEPEDVYKAFYVLESKASGVSRIEASSSDEVVYFDLQGRRVNNPKGGIFIRKAGDKVQKVLMPR